MNEFSVPLLFMKNDKRSQNNGIYEDNSFSRNRIT